MHARIALPYCLWHILGEHGDVLVGEARGEGRGGGVAGSARGRLGARDDEDARALPEQPRAGELRGLAAEARSVRGERGGAGRV